MEFHCLPIIFSLNLMLMATHAALPPLIYWERMLPNTPMPKAITELLSLGGGVLSTGYMQKPINGDQKAHIIEWGKNVDTKTQSKDEFPFYLYGAKGAKETHSPDEFPFYIYGAKGAKETPSQDEFPFYLYGAKGAKEAKETPSQDEFPFYLYGAKGVKDTPSQDEFPFYFYGAKETPSQTPSQDEFPFYLYGAKGAIETPSQDEFPFYLYGAKGAKVTPSQDEFPFYLYGAKVAKETPSQEEFPFYLYSAKEIQSHNDANAPPLEMRHVANNHQLHDNPNEGLIFFEEDLRPGTKFDVHFSKRKYAAPLLPRQVTQHIPFSSDKMKEVMEILSVKTKSKNAEIIEKAIGLCEAPTMDGEEKYCATSLESMVDFITSKLGNNVGAISTEVEKETKLQKFSVKDGVKKLADDKVIACHPMAYPYVVLFCHELQKSSAYFMPFEGEDGARVKAVAVCHKDTSKWDPKHLAFQVLKVKPGTVPVCHIFPEGHLLWFAK